MKITRAWLTENTKCGAPTKAQLLALGVRWPPSSGWMQELEGMEISELAAQDYINGQNIHVHKQKFKKHKNQLKPTLEFQLDFMTKRPVPIHIARITLGNSEDASLIRLCLLPDGLHAFIENSKFAHIAMYDANLDYEFSGLAPKEEK